ncbi:Helix-turn-helix domain-containing protein [Dyadobacter koreensis]|uniref:Helix-turn-helix domain-containing protein n=1 Tax=Dyadobacter koreensis TaxID=408657 RepID=A0A1H6R286_9BACT|nr:LexA family transcriptional regulator [Dyadobacter koreensis]SEI45322.1 Helix-turn-helix domain-containing protein [Dyadobacter koreensis]
MVTATLFFHSNIRFLRERRKFSQEDISEVLDLSRNKLQALESGKTKNPSVQDLIKFSEYFKVSVDTLLKVDLSTLGELKLKELQAGNDVYMTGSQIRILAITVDKENLENTEYVPVKAKAGYQAGYNDPQYLAALPRFSLPNLPKQGTFRMFPTVGDSMLPIPEGSDIIAEYVQDWKNLKPETPCIVILKGNQDFVFKMVTVQNNGRLLLKSLNSLYQPFEVNSEDVLEVWKYYKHQTDTLPEPETDLQQIKNLLVAFHSEVKKK